MNLAEAIEKAEDLKKLKKCDDIITLLTPYWKEKVTTNVGSLLAYSYRRLKEYDKCLEICDAVDKASNYPAKIKSQRQWCLIFRDIVDANSDDSEIVAKKTLSSLNFNNSYDLSVYNFICILMAGKTNSIEWLEKIPSHKLNNKVSFDFDEITGKDKIKISEKNKYYTLLIEILIQNKNDESFQKLKDYLNSIMTAFNPVSKNSFLNSIISSVLGKDSDGQKFLKRKKLQIFLMHLKESEHYIKNNTVKVTDTLKMSDIASFVFCPISSIISKTLVTQDLSLEYNEHISFSKKYLNDYFEIEKKNINSWWQLLNDSSIYGLEFTEQQINFFSRLFSAQRESLNSRVGSSYLSNIFKGEDISFSPDMVLIDSAGKFCVEEVFTSSALNSLAQPYENDKIKLIGYLTELKIEKGYLVYWNLIYKSEINNSNKKKALISGVKIFEINLNQLLKNEYLDYKDKLKQLINNGSQPTPAINFNKCVSCSVMHYCVHKYGNSPLLKNPYKSNYLNK